MLFRSLLVQFQLGFEGEGLMPLENLQSLRKVWWSNRLEPTTISANSWRWLGSNLARASSQSNVLGQVVITKLEFLGQPQEVLARLRDRAAASLLESASLMPGLSGWSYIACAPRRSRSSVCHRVWKRITEPFKAHCLEVHTSKCARV